MPALSTGYFGTPGTYGGKTHIVIDGKPICGTRIARRAEYHWCSPRVDFGMIECQRCKPIARRIADEQHAAHIAAISRGK